MREGRREESEGREGGREGIKGQCVSMYEGGGGGCKQ